MSDIVMNSKVSNLRLFDLLTLFKENDNPAFYVKKSGSWKGLSYKEYFDLSERFSYAIIHEGIKQGEKVASILNNRPEWNIIDMGSLQAGAVHVSLFPTFSKDSLLYTLNHARVKLLFISNRSLYRVILKLKDQLTHLKRVILVGKDEQDEFYHFINQAPANHESLSQVKRKVKPEDICSILYTSGTSEVPKGVPISHQSFLLYASTFEETYSDLCGQHVLSFLPLCHGFERSHSYFYQLYAKTVYYTDAGQHLNEIIDEGKVSFFTTVPMVLNSIKSNGDLKAIAVSGAPLEKQVQDDFNKREIKLLTSYGCTETLGISANFYDSLRSSTVGRPLEYVKLKIDNGEILVKSPTMLTGYYQYGNSNHLHFDKEGYFRTGDLGELEPEGFLRILGRKGDFFKTENGRFFNPKPLEEELSSFPCIKNAIIVGAGKPYLTALIVPNQDNNGIGKDEITKAVESYNQQVNDFERIEKFKIIFDTWSPDSGEFTHNLKLRRTFVLSKYENKVNELYL